MDFKAARERMVTEQLEGRGIRDPRVLEAMRAVPRERFVNAGWEARAYEDRPLPIGHGQTISQPYIVARMAELAALAAHERVLEVGAGSGYAAAVLARLCAEVYAVEIVPELAEASRRRLSLLGIGNVTLEGFDGSQGWAQKAPFDAILVSAGAPRIPALLIAQLADRGRLVIPVGEREDQQLVVITRRGEEFDTHRDTPVRFVDLTGRYGWGGSGPAEA